MSRKDRQPFDRTLKSLSATGFFISAQQQMINPVIGIYANESLRVSPALVGYIFTLFSLSSLLTKLSSFMITTRRRVANPLFVSGLLISVFAPVGYVLVEDYVALLILRIVHGAAFAYDTVLMLTVAGHTQDKNELLNAIQRYTTFLAVGLTAGPVIGTASVSLFGVRQTLLASSAMGVGAFITGFRSVRLVFDKSDTPTSTSSKQSTLKPLRDRVLIYTSLAYLSYNIAYGGVLAFSPLIARKEIGLTENLITVLFFLYYFSALLSRAMLSKLISRIKVQTVYQLILLISAVGALLIAVFRSPAVFASGYVLMAVAHGLSFPLSTLIIARHYENDAARLTANSILMSMWDAGMMVGPLVSSAFLAIIPLNFVLIPMVVFPVAGCLFMILVSGTLDKYSRK
ncbi:MAG: MFS transporter [Candidatus Caldarchaeum sp.]|nr:MFS transporter [Candidatus Caldarchaeum sp.]